MQTCDDVKIFYITNTFYALSTLMKTKIIYDEK